MATFLLWIINRENKKFFVQTNFHGSSKFIIVQFSMYKPRGVLLGAISKRFDTIVEFTAFEDFISFERKGKNKVKRVENNKIKVTIEVDMVCGVVN